MKSFLNDISIVPNTRYYYTVKAVNSNGPSSNSNMVDITPIAPSGLTITNASRKLILNWNSIAGATGYSIKRATTSGAEAPVSTSPTNSYTDLNLTNGTKYYYKVSANLVSGITLDSIEAFGTPNLQPLIPALTSNTAADGGELTSSPAASNAYLTCNRTDAWAGPVNGSVCWMQYKFPVPTSLEQAVATCGGNAINGNPQTYVQFVLEGSNDGSSYTTLANVTTLAGYSYAAAATMNISPVIYTYYRITGTGTTFDKWFRWMGFNLYG